MILLVVAMIALVPITFALCAVIYDVFAASCRLYDRWQHRRIAQNDAAVAQTGEGLDAWSVLRRSRTDGEE